MSGLDHRGTTERPYRLGNLPNLSLSLKDKTNMDYAMSNEGTKIPKAFKKAKAGKASGVARGKLMYMKAIKQAKKGK